MKLDSDMVSAARISNVRILVVDDQSEMVELLDQMLRRAGYQLVDSTTSPGEVQDLQIKNHYDLILLDIQMPEMDGFTVIERLHEIAPGGLMPIIVVLSAQPTHEQRALNCGASDFVSKPFDVPNLLMRIHNLIELRLLGA